MSRRTLIILLTISGGINLFIAGLVVASLFFHGWRGGPPGRHHGPLNFRAAMATLSEPSREKARAIWVKNLPQLRERIRARRKIRRSLRDLTRSGNPTPTEIDAILKKLSLERGETERMVHGILLRIGGQLRADERSKFYRSVFKRRRFFRRRHHDRERRRERRRDREEKR